MDFILNGIKYRISDLEVFISYLFADKYFESSDYDISFDFLDGFRKELTFEDLSRGAEIIAEMNPGFINPNLTIEAGETFNIGYQSIKFTDLYPGEAISVLIVLNSLIEHKPALTLDEIEGEVDTFIASHRKKFIN
ncbi:hypothetical protein [Methanobrevibacter sp.]|uniref:hypothetical protein n=1 Tax=Methanobrevibacter sp. TaxID=66852 RepID=UPI00388FE3FA